MSLLRSALDRVRQKNLHTWVPGYLKWAAERAARSLRAPAPARRHLLFAFCDHHEPLWHTDDRAVGLERIRAWHEGYPRLADGFRDADGRPPRHSFFFPGEQYDPAFLDPLADLTRRGFGEVEVHLHHDADTEEKLRADLLGFLARLDGHGLLTRDTQGKLRFAFIHGNWCLANARADGRYCGVDAELPLLFDIGCYADFTFPSAPDESQPGIVNRIYWPAGDLRRRRSYEGGVPARVGERRDDRILMIEGPLVPALRRRGRIPGVRIESAELAAYDPPTPARIRAWVDAGIGVEGRPEWVFVKVHTHGSAAHHAAALLGEAGQVLHGELTTRYNDGERWRLHYVTAREMFNIALAAMDGHTGDPNAYRDYRLPPPPAATISAPG